MDRAEYVFTKIAGWDRYMELLKGTKAKEMKKATEGLAEKLKTVLEGWKSTNTNSEKDFDNLLAIRNKKEFEPIRDYRVENMKVWGTRAATAAGAGALALGGKKLLNKE